jgi:hypothetical protein
MSINSISESHYNNVDLFPFGEYPKIEAFDDNVAGDPPEKQKSASFLTKVKKIQTVFENVIWEYINQTAKVIKQTLKITILACPKYAARLSKVVAHLGFMSGISILLSLKSLPDQLKGIIHNLKLKDGEGAAISGLDFLSSLGGILDDVGTLTSTLAYIGLIPAITFFGIIAAPLAVSLLAYSSAIKTYHIFRHSRFLAALPKQITTENFDKFTQYLEKKLNDPNEKLKKRKINILSRHADSRVVNIMKNLRQHMATTPTDLETANKALKDMKTLMIRKIALNSVSIVSNVAMATAIVAGTAFPPLAAATPFIALGKAATSIGTHTYKTFFFDSKLKLPAFTKAAPAS